MKQLQKKYSLYMLFAVILFLLTGMTVQAQENILGDWTFTMEMPADAGGMGMGGPGGGMPAITISSAFTKGTDGTITGTWVMNMEGGMGGPGGGMGDFQMPTFKIVDVKIDGQKLSFTRKAEGDTAAGGMGGGMMMEDRQFTGTIKGDTIELKSASQMGEMTYKGTRKAAAAPAAVTTAAGGDALTGDWIFTMSMADSGMGMGAMEFIIKSTITKGADGKYAMTWEQQQSPDMGGGMGGFTMPQVKNEDIKLDGDKLTFKHIASFGDMGGMGGGGDMVFNFTGTLKGDTIEGKLAGTDNGMGMGATEMKIVAKKQSKSPVAVTTASATGLEGAWEFVTTFSDMGMEIKANATFTKAADGKYSCKWEGLPMEGGMGMADMPVPTVTISDIKLDGEKLTFVQKVDLSSMQMGEMTSNFSGTLKGDKIEGTFASDTGDSKSVATRKKAAAATPATPAAGVDALTGNWELTMNMGDMGMGMAMEFNIKSTITKDAAGKYAMTWEQTMNAPEGMGGPGGDMGGMGAMPQPTVTISDIKLDGEKLTFTQKVSFGDMGGGMGGPDGGIEITSKFTGTVKDNVMEGKMLGEDNGMGMGAMEFTVKGSKK